MANYFNTLSLREQLAQLGKCEFMDPAAFSDGVSVLKGKKTGGHRLWFTGTQSGLEFAGQRP